MKKSGLLAGIFLAFLTLSACAEKIEVTLPFEASDINFAVIYRYDVPADAQEKLVDSAEEIKLLYNSIAGKTGELLEKEEDWTGGTTTSFHFSLMDGTSYEAAYTDTGTRDGVLRLLTEDKRYVTSADIGSVWDDCSGTIREVHEGMLPGDPSGVTTEPIEGTELLPGLYEAEGYDQYFEPSLRLYVDETASLTYSGLSSDIPTGKIRIEKDRLILMDDVFDKEYTFLIDGKDLIFRSDESAEIPQLDENTLKDGARFFFQGESGINY